MKREQVLGGILGLCIGDALGVPFEGRSREEMHNLGKNIEKSYRGLWSDDSSLTLCLAQSLCEGFDLSDLAQRFIRWLDEGYMTPQGSAFGIGRTTYMAINNLKKGAGLKHCGLTDEYSNGNGSLMRILPMAFYCFNMDEQERFDLVSRVSALTHAHPRSVLACCVYTQLATELISQQDKGIAYRKMKKVIKKYFSGDSQLPYFKSILESDISTLDREDIGAGGYVVESLEASIWCFLRHTDYTDTVMEAIRLGQDADTTAAEAGGLAGMFYGVDSIPGKWQEGLARKEDILDIANNLWKSLG
ncbi:MAG: ADP-ribosylglycohydrolase family protein [Actinomycetia bacterium]|nr:ADP-ribosylglycohydrolase family protein [Actinomycetes bacterium]